MIVKSVLTFAYIIILTVLYTGSVEASQGDQSYFFQKCVIHCHDVNCTHAENFERKQPFHHRLLKWSCVDECEYMCMWPTVQAFLQDGRDVPQFHGKWPFIRIWGMQEPASVLFSILNLLGHLSIFVYRYYVSSSSPMFYVWNVGCLVALNAWSWSTVYHMRDTDFTEGMDYFFAFSVILYNAFALCCRILGQQRKLILSVIGISFLVFYVRHIHYLRYINFDYGYNMNVNVAFGVISMFGWLLWCASKFKSRPYVWKCAVVVFSVNGLLLLELFDFPPFFWMFDGHSLWHAGTAPLTLLWYSFLKDDSLYELERMKDLAMKLD